MSHSIDRSIELAGVARAEDARRRFDACCAGYQGDLFRFLFWLCRDRALAEDVMQETLLRAWKSIEALERPEAARAWLLTIARRELARALERTRAPTMDIDSIIEGADPALTVSESHDVQDMRRAIFKLDVLYREPLAMQVLLGLTTEEIARELAISAPAVLTRLFRARQLLRKQLLGAPDDEDACE